MSLNNPYTTRRPPKILSIGPSSPGIVTKYLSIPIPKPEKNSPIINARTVPNSW